ncbi:hypothetical protein AB838_07670 [Rhodobacteraceae bacterium (ex Bugula neritina AB1)]|nr:hypothetical protein AB838_07670 [Rhodobacteraceae bacterium (ex Bugula neritina AB1)]
MTGGQISMPGLNRQLTWSVAHKAKLAGHASGDGYLVSRDDQYAMFAVADGSGSGQEAAQATEHCLAALGRQAEFDLPAGFRDCHSVLRGSRGAALGIVLIDMQSGRFSWASVGDIDGMLVRADNGRPNESIIQRGGVLGLNLPRLHQAEHALYPDDLIIMTSDGIKRAYRTHVTAATSADQTTASIMEQFAHPRDDSIVLAVSMGAVG